MTHTNVAITYHCPFLSLVLNISPLSGWQELRLLGQISSPIQSMQSSSRNLNGRGWQRACSSGPFHLPWCCLARLWPFTISSSLPGLQVPLVLKVCCCSFSLQHMEIPRPGVELELELLAYTTATATPDSSCTGTNTTAPGNARSLTHWVRPGMEPASSWILVRFVTHWATLGTPIRGFESQSQTPLYGILSLFSSREDFLSSSGKGIVFASHSALPF